MSTQGPDEQDKSIEQLGQELLAAAQRFVQIEQDMHDAVDNSMTEEHGADWRDYQDDSEIAKNLVFFQERHDRQYDFGRHQESESFNYLVTLNRVEILNNSAQLVDIFKEFQNAQNDLIQANAALSSFFNMISSPENIQQSIYTTQTTPGIIDLFERCANAKPFTVNLCEEMTANLSAIDLSRVTPVFFNDIFNPMIQEYLSENCRMGDGCRFDGPREKALLALFSRQDFRENLKQGISEGSYKPILDEDLCGSFQNYCGRIDFKDKKQLEMMPLRVELVKLLLPLFFKVNLYEKDGSERLKSLDQKPMEWHKLTFENILRSINNYLNQKIRADIPLDVDHMIKNFSPPRLRIENGKIIENGRELTVNSFGEIRTFLEALSQFNPDLTKDVCVAINQAVPELTQKIQRELQEDRQAELQKEVKENFDKSVKIVSTLGFKKFRENQPLDSNVTSKDKIKEGRQRIETAVESLVDKGYLPEVIDKPQRDKLIKVMKKLDADKMTVPGIKKQIKEELKLEKNTFKKK